MIKFRLAKQSTKSHFLYDMVVGDDIVGRFHFSIPKGTSHIYLLNISVKTEFQRNGYGKLAMKEIERHAREMRIKEIRLNVFGNNEAGVKLYESCGYKPELLTMLRVVPEEIQ